MPWYTYILFAVFIISCFIFFTVVLLQSGKGDIASAFGGGGSQTAFGPRSAGSTLSKVTMGAAIAFMVLSFVFSLPGVMGAGSVAEHIKDEPVAPAPAPATPKAVTPATTPAPSAPAVQPATTPAPAPATTPAVNSSAPAGEKPATDNKGKEETKKSEDKKPAENKPAGK